MKIRLLILLICSAGPLAAAADLSALGAWSEIINAADMVAGAGSGLHNPESGSGATTLSVSNPLVTWRVLARRSGGSWPGGVAIWLKRISDGSGLGVISGGASYVQLSGSNTEIFSGLLGRSNIGLRYKVTGLSLSVPPATYHAPIVFTVVSP